MNYFCRLIIFSAFFALAQTSQASLTQAEELGVIQKARAFYAQGKYDLAIEEYNKITNKSDFWIDATEEKAWSYTNKKDYGKAKAELKSLLNPVFLPLSSSDVIVLSAFVDLKVCNYKGAAEAIPLFKKTLLPRVEALEEITHNKKQALIKKWVSRASEFPLTIEQVGQDALLLPRLFHRIGRVSEAKIKKMAQEELDQISKNLKKMKILEIELIHRTQISSVKTAENKKLSFDKAKSKDALIFPVKDGSQEVWLDEIGKYETETTECSKEGSL